MALRPGSMVRRLAGTSLWNALAPRRPVPLVYHGVSADPDPLDMRLDVFSRHLEYLATTHDIVRWDDDPPERRGDRTRVVLTFDDGLGSNAEVVAPLLRRLGIPAMFFVTTRHCTPGRYLWFRHLDLLEKHFPGRSLRFRGQAWDMSSDAARRSSIARIGDILIDLEPHPIAMYKAIDEGLPPLEDFASEATLRQARGMTPAEVRSLAADELFCVGAHTEDHPYLTRCLPDEARRQLVESKRWLELTTGRPCPYLAYPSGDYDKATIRLAAEAGYQRAFAVRPHNRGDSRMETARFGVHRESIEDLAIKIQWGSWLRVAGRPVN